MTSTLNFALLSWHIKQFAVVHRTFLSGPILGHDTYAGNINLEMYKARNGYDLLNATRRDVIGSFEHSIEPSRVQNVRPIWVNYIFHKYCPYAKVRGGAFGWGRGFDSRWCHWNFSLT
jgi:hypothetical protein